MNRGRLAVLAVAALVAVAAFFASRDPAPPVRGGPHVVFWLTCTTRRDQLSPFGGPPETTPFLARLAAEGAAFDDAIAGSSWTKESATALLAGVPALDAGMADPGTGLGRRRLPDELTTLAEHLQAAGWWTAGVTANPHLDGRFGFAQGIDAYVGAVEDGFRRTNKRGASEVVERALGLLDARTGAERRRPIFLQLTTIDPHFPITVEPDERRRFLAPGVPRLLADYRAMLRRADDAMADLERRLTAYGVRPEETLWVVVADHGEGLELPPHHRAQHGRVLYDSLVRVGWLVRGPGVRPGTRVTGLASHLDVLPTVLGLAGLAPAPPADPLASGFDLAPVLRAGGSTTPRRVAATATWYEGAARGALWTSEAACQADWGSVGIAGDTFAPGCFDRRADPTFLTPVENPALSSALDRWYADAAARGRARGPAPEAPPDDPVREQLEALGYAE